MNKKNIVITLPKLNKAGGVASFYNAVLPHLDKAVFQVNTLEIGSGNSVVSYLQPLFDQFRLFKAVSNKTVLVHINPSLGFKSFFRDGLFTIISKYKKKPVIVFFHGWSKDFEHHVKHRLNWFFKYSFGRADAFIVLASEFKNFLIDVGIKAPIHLETTAIDETLISDFNIDDKITSLSSTTSFRILFLSRLEREKGVFETIDAVKLLLDEGMPVTLSIAGDGPILEELKDYTKKQALKDTQIRFLGYVSGDDKIKVFSEHDIYCFPTNYGEGLPTSVLEAMVFGLPVITRPVGGLADHFENDVMGKLCQTMNPEEIAQSIKALVTDIPVMLKIARYNHDHAVKTFLASQVAQRLSSIYQSTLSEIQPTSVPKS